MKSSKFYFEDQRNLKKTTELKKMKLTKIKGVKLQKVSRTRLNTSTATQRLR